jgi:hypothetical protein
MFSKPSIKVDILVLHEALEAIAIRSVLESFAIEVRCRFIGNVKELVSILGGQEQLHEIVVISCHGDERGIILPELYAELEKEMPSRRILTASNLAEFLKLQDQIVINTGCCLGKNNFAKSFVEGGALAYIGLETEVEGNAVMFFVISFFYFLLCKHLPLNDAFEKAKSTDKETSLVKLHQRNKL